MIDDEDDFDISSYETIAEDELASLYVNLEKCPKRAKHKPAAERWLPSLTDDQMEVFNDTSPNLLVQSSRFTGKSYAIGYCIARHLWDFPGAFVLLVTRTKRQALAGGLMTKMDTMILPDMANNLEGFAHSSIRMTVEKDAIISVTNRFGTQSICQLISLASDTDVAKKLRGIESSLVVIDEILLWDNEDIYSQLSQTLGRRPNIPPEHQRLLASCNPGSPTCWQANLWSVMDPSKRDPAFRVIRLLPSSNPSPHVAAYYERLRQSLRNNPTQYARDIDGLWVEVPTGDSLFGDYFNADRHVIGDAALRTGLQPLKNLPILLGLDLGDTNHGVSIMQTVPTKDKTLWLIVDEFESVGKRVSLEEVTRKIMVKINGWGQALDFDFTVTAVSDNSAFNRYRSGTGSLDHAEIEKHWKTMMPQFPRIKFPLRILEAPKGDGSVAVRTRLIQDLFTREEMYVSATCKAHISMLTKITGTKKTPQAPDTHDPRKHIFDALSYVVVHQKTSEMPEEENEETLKPEIIRMGARSLR
jgi:hypothetical protein